jgi:hypothetical protein
MARRQARWERRSMYGPPNPLSGAIIGLLLIAAGGLFLLRNLGIFYFASLWNYWPVILVALGLTKLVAPRSGHDFVPGAILTILGSIFLLRNLGYIRGSIGGFIWSGALIAIGAALLMRHLYGPDWFGGGGSSAGIADSSASDAKKLRLDVVFGGVNRKFVSQEFEGGKISVLFAGANIDLREANIQQAETVINADAVFGGIDLKVPDTWLVEARGSGLFGGYEDLTHHPTQTGTTPPPRVIVKGGALFGGVTVRN